LLVVGVAFLILGYAAVPLILLPPAPDLLAPHAAVDQSDPRLAMSRLLSTAGWLLTVIGLAASTARRLLWVLAGATVLAIVFAGILGLGAALLGVTAGLALGTYGWSRPPLWVGLVIAWFVLGIIGGMDSVVSSPVGGWIYLARDLGYVSFFALLGALAGRYLGRQKAATTSVPPTMPAQPT